MRQILAKHLHCCQQQKVRRKEKFDQNQVIFATDLVTLWYYCTIWPDPDCWFSTNLVTLWFYCADFSTTSNFDQNFVITTPKSVESEDNDIEEDLKIKAIIERCMPQCRLIQVWFPMGRISHHFSSKLTAIFWKMKASNWRLFFLNWVRFEASNWRVFS